MITRRMALDSPAVAIPLALLAVALIAAWCRALAQPEQDPEDAHLYI